MLGGLTRDEVKYLSDKVPVLGDVPMLGKLFRSEGESRQKPLDICYGKSCQSGWFSFSSGLS